MNRKEQIKEQLRSYLIWFGDALAIHEDALNNLTDDILALPLDVPGDEEIREQFPFYDEGIDLISNLDCQMGAEWMRDEIIKRNRP